MASLTSTFAWIVGLAFGEAFEWSLFAQNQSVITTNLKPPIVQLDSKVKISWSIFVEWVVVITKILFLAFSILGSTRGTRACELQTDSTFSPWFSEWPNLKHDDLSRRTGLNRARGQPCSNLNFTTTTCWLRWGQRSFADHSNFKAIWAD